MQLSIKYIHYLFMQVFYFAWFTIPPIHLCQSRGWSVWYTVPRMSYCIPTEISYCIPYIAHRIEKLRYDKISYWYYTEYSIWLFFIPLSYLYCGIPKYGTIYRIYGIYQIFDITAVQKNWYRYCTKNYGISKIDIFSTVSVVF